MKQWMELQETISKINETVNVLKLLLLRDLWRPHNHHPHLYQDSSTKAPIKSIVTTVFLPMIVYIKLRIDRFLFALFLVQGFFIMFAFISFNTLSCYGSGKFIAHCKIITAPELRMLRVSFSVFGWSV